MSASPVPGPSSSEIYRRLLGYIKPVWWAFALSVLGFLLYGAATAWFGKLLEQVVNAIQPGVVETTSSDSDIPLVGDVLNFLGDLIPRAEGENARVLIPLQLMALVLVRTTGGFLGAYFMGLLAWRIVHRMRCEIIEAFLRLPLAFHDRQTSGHLLSTVTFNVAQITAAVSDALAVMFREGATVLMIMIALLLMNWKLTLIFVSLTPLISGVVVFASRYFRRYSKRIQTSMGDVTQNLSEALKGLKVIRTFGARDQILEKFSASSLRNSNQNMKLILTSAISAPIVHVLVSAAIALLVWRAMDPAALAATTPGEFVGFITLAGMLLKPVRQTSKVNADIQKGVAAASSVFELLDMAGESDTGTRSVERVQGKVEFRNASFGYESSTEPVLDQVNLLCQPGQTVAIVGKSGSGKTTLVNLIPRFYELQGGQILVDDVPHTNYTLASLRHQIALVSQQVVLFHGTIRENLAYGELAKVSEEDLIRALDHAHAMEFIRELPDGLNTVVGDDGLLLSGGQRQRLAIARALLKNAPILILDEATSALDSASERHIQDALQTLMRGRTTLVIAHRLSTIESADLIVVMDKGRIIETGTHQTLLAKDGAYAMLHKLQFAEVVSE